MFFLKNKLPYESVDFFSYASLISDVILSDYNYFFNDENVYKILRFDICDQKKFIINYVAAATFLSKWYLGSLFPPKQREHYGSFSDAIDREIISRIYGENLTNERYRQIHTRLYDIFDECISIFKQSNEERTRLETIIKLIYQPFEDDGFSIYPARAHIYVLMNVQIVQFILFSRYTKADFLGDIPNFKVCLVEIEKQVKEYANKVFDIPYSK